MEASSSTNRKREREAAASGQEGTAEEERSQTLYIQCKHMSKPWDLLNGFLAQHRDAVGLSDLYDVTAESTPTEESKGSNGASAGGSATAPVAVLKRTAPIDVAYVHWSRKPYFLLEFTGAGAAERARRLLAIPQQDRVFRGMPVTVSPAMNGMSVAVERQKSEELEQKGKVQPSHAAHAAPPRENHASAEASAPLRGTKSSGDTDGKANAPGLQRPTVTSFIPRIVKR